LFVELFSKYDFLATTRLLGEFRAGFGQVPVEIFVGTRKVGYRFAVRDPVYIKYLNTAVNMSICPMCNSCISFLILVAAEAKAETREKDLS